MPKKPQLHPYADRLSFERILLLIATLIHYPGIGTTDGEERPKNSNPHNALASLQTQLCEVAQSIGIQFPDHYPSIGTLRKDLQTLRDFQILDRRMYRWGYYLGTGAMSREELKVAFNALHSQALYQGDPQIRQIYQTLEKRLRGLELETHSDFFYPVRAYLNRPIIYTDPDQMQRQGNNRHTLFHCLDTLENAIATGQLVELYRRSEPYQQQTGYIQVFPLQLFYHDIAWYLLYEYPDSQHLEVERVDRFKDHCRRVDYPKRGQTQQRESLKTAQKLMGTGWGIYLGTPSDQQLERQGQLLLPEVKVRFFPPATTFILEGECRHPRQKIHRQTDSKGECICVDYTIKLPPRSFHEFSRWVYRYMGCAQVLSPPDLVEKHRQAAQALMARYES
ncbi:MAG TPA: WYL domain-containing protein [Cyanobacteria bacterium UBA11162]|nr:WYL domain-containing protein [Cyanobacteria bacterium UBA11162]